MLGAIKSNFQGYSISLSKKEVQGLLFTAGSTLILGVAIVFLPSVIPPFAKIGLGVTGCVVLAFGLSKWFANNRKAVVHSVKRESQRLQENTSLIKD